MFLFLIHLKTDQPMLNHQHIQQVVTLQPTVQDTVQGTLLLFRTMLPHLITTLDTLLLLLLDMELVLLLMDPAMVPFHSVMAPEWLTPMALAMV